MAWQTTWWARVTLAGVLSSVLLLAATMLHAHEIRPAVMDLDLSGGTAEIEWAIEAPVAGLDLQGLEDTNEAEGAADYDALRALGPDEMAARFEAAWPGIAEALTFRAGGGPVVPELTSVDVPEIGDVEAPRFSVVTVALPLPDGADSLTVDWPPAYGPVVIRDAGSEDGFATFLPTGGTTEPIPLAGGADAQSGLGAFVEYIGVGFDHIVPMGLDHILFVLGLYFLATTTSALLWQVTAFTLAHTVTLALGATGLVSVPASVVEPLIAASIVYVGIENVLARGLTPWRPVVVFCFGLLHGLGFASVLRDFGLGGSNFVPKLIGFNVGVEFGQLAVILAAALALGLFFAREPWWRMRVAAPVSIAIAVIAAFWTLERTGVVGEDGVFAVIAGIANGTLPAVPIMVGTVVALALLSGVEMATDSDAAREAAGFVTSFFAFLATVATFMAGAWLPMAVVVVVWVVCLRAQALGGPEGDVA